MYHKETLLVIGTINFTIESLAIKNRRLDGVHSISDIKLLWYDGSKSCSVSEAQSGGKE